MELPNQILSSTLTSGSLIWTTTSTMTRTSNRIPSHPPFPWDLLKADCLRMVCTQLGSRQYHTKAKMFEFLQNVEQHGVEHALNDEREAKESMEAEMNKSSAPENQTSTSTTTRRRKRQPDEVPEGAKEDSGPSTQHYNTRHKGQKRVRVSAGPLRFPRQPRPTVQQRQPQSSASTYVTPKNSAPRKRGRPRKGSEKAVKKPTVAVAPSRRREVFDGVVLPRRGTMAEVHPEDVDADGEEIDENEDDEQFIVMTNGVASSLASSNKENDPFVPPDPALLLSRTHNSLADAYNSLGSP